MSLKQQICNDHCMCTVCVNNSKCKRCEKMCKDKQLSPKIVCLQFKQKKGTSL